MWVCGCVGNVWDVMGVFALCQLWICGMDLKIFVGDCVIVAVGVWV